MLTLKQIKFIALYDGNGADAARKAGYKGSPQSLAVMASRMLTDPKIAEGINKRVTKEIHSLVLTRKQRQEWWSGVMLDKGLDINARLKASELLGRSEGDFTDKVEVVGDSIERLAKAVERVVATGFKMEMPPGAKV